MSAPKRRRTDNLPEEVSLLERKWVELPEARHITITQSMMVMHLNALADQLSDADGFVGTTSEAMAWENRSQQLLALIDRNIDYNGLRLGILSLVECDQVHYDNFWKHELAMRGLYWSCLARKTGTDKTHGVALFVDDNRYKVVGHKVINDPVAAVSVILLDKWSNETFMVLTTHLKAKPHAESIRRQQLERLVQEYQAFRDHGLPMIFLGDFNAPLEEPAISQTQTKLDLTAVGKLPWTTWKERPKTKWQKGGLVKRSIDHILVSQKVSLQAYLDVPTDQSVKESGLLPGTSYPSDHLAIWAILRIY